MPTQIGAEQPLLRDAPNTPSQRLRREMGMTMEWLASEGENDEPETGDTTGQFLRLLEDLKLYSPNTIFDGPSRKPAREDFGGVEGDVFVRVVEILRRYVRPRKDVERIRRAVNANLQYRDLSALDGVYGRLSRVRGEVAELRGLKEGLKRELAGVGTRRQSGGDMQTVLMGKMVLERATKESDVLRIYNEHLRKLLDSPEKVDNQTTLVGPLFPYQVDFGVETHRRIIDFIKPLDILPPRLFPNLRTSSLRKTNNAPNNPLPNLQTKTHSPIPLLHNSHPNPIPA
jgi:hypothetical protein